MHIKWVNITSHAFVHEGVGLLGVQVEVTTDSNSEQCLQDTESQ